MPVKSTRLPRKIQPHHVRIGDLCRYTTHVDDITISVVGKLAKREYKGRATFFYSARGQLLGVDWGNNVDILTITLLDNAPDVNDIALEGIEL